MPVINADGCPINVVVEGPEGAPHLILSNSLGTTLRMWDAQLAPFTQSFRVVRFDRRGHGKSGVPEGPYSMERFGRDVLPILSANCFACSIAFCPVDASRTRSTSCGASAITFCMTRLIFESSFIRFTLLCSLPAVSIIIISEFFQREKDP